MKGLILKDLYLIVHYCKTSIILMCLFLILSLTAVDSGVYFLIFPCIFSGMLPMSLLAWDEKEKWNVYSLTLPVNRNQYVAAKYLIGLLSAGFVCLSFGVAYGIIQISSFSLGEFLSSLSFMFTASLCVPAVLLPFLFRFGSEKGRLMYFVVLIAVFFLLSIVGRISDFFLPSVSFFPSLLPLSAAGIYVFSGGVSCILYRKRAL